ncbi:hypothetical protein [Nonomuraea dietziae]|uniref:hypothetical protein n=1 Tax=Nonomuraea dietziae TaxID=65515 RepID=UPI003CD05FD3
MAFSPDGQTLASSDNAGTILLWRPGIPADPLKAVCALAGRSLTEQEWRLYLPEGEPHKKIC